MAKKKGLGKGLGALLSNTSIDNMMDSNANEIKNIDIDKIKANVDQPRKSFDEDSLRDLSESIKEYGVIQPILVREKNKTYEIIAGERRYRAAKLAGLSQIPTIIKDFDDFEVDKISLIENIQREDLSIMEEARAYKRLLEEHKLTQEELSKEVSKSRSHIANTMRLLKLDEETLSLIEEGKITKGHGRALLSVAEEEREDLVKDILDKNLNVREVEKKAKSKKESVKKEDIYIKDLEEKLMMVLGTKIKIKDKKGKGKIEIDYYSYDELDGIVEDIKR